MNTRQRQLVLLVGFMALLGVIFAFVNVGDTVREQFNPKVDMPDRNQTSGNQSQQSSPGLFQQSINGLQMLLRDAQKGLSIFSSGSS